MYRKRSLKSAETDFLPGLEIESYSKLGVPKGMPSFPRDRCEDGIPNTG